MRILVGWNDDAEAELISLYLGAGENEARLTSRSEDLLAAANNDGPWDALLLATVFPDADAAYSTFVELRRLLPDCPIVGACHTQDVFKIARFLMQGMRAYVLRDAAGDFVFLIQAALEGAVQAVQAEHEQKLAGRLREEIDSVRKLQESMIPRDLNTPPGYEICARYEPSQIQVMGGRPVIMAGGDYYDVFSLDEQSAVLLVGDASGHGMKACMSIMTMHTLVRMIRGNRYRETATFVAEINRRLCEQSLLQDDGGFITLIYAALRTDRHELQWTSAGHPLPIIQDLETNEVRSIEAVDAGGMPLGVFSEETYATCTTPIPPHNRVLLYTDGLVEAFPEGGGEHNEFGMNGIIATLKRCRSLSLDQTMQALFDDSNAFTRGFGRHDDTSVVLLERA